MRRKSKTFLRLFQCVCLAAFLGAGVPAFAGGWTSGGGELLESNTNPWFIFAGGTHRILKYCILADETNFGVSRADLSLQARAALNAWHGEFAAATIPDNGVGNRVHVGTELFVENQSCDDAAIRFQFGVLTDGQLDYFKSREQDPHKLVAVAVRTSYDEEKLDGKGFVYIAPPKGPLAMNGRDVRDDPWQYAGQVMLNAVLRHELGHVFGLGHTGTYQELMGADFPESAVSSHALFFSFNFNIFRIPVGIDLNQSCAATGGSHPRSFPDLLVKFFGIPNDMLCFATRIYADKMQVVARPHQDGRETVIGDITFDPEVEKTLVPLVRLWLPEAQKVFPNVPDYLGKVLTGPTAIKTQRTGTYTVFATHEQRPVKVTLAPERVQVDGVFEGRIHLDLTSFPWSSL